MAPKAAAAAKGNSAGAAGRAGGARRVVLQPSLLAAARSLGPEERATEAAQLLRGLGRLALQVPKPSGEGTRSQPPIQLPKTKELRPQRLVAGARSSHDLRRQPRPSREGEPKEEQVSEDINKPDIRRAARRAGCARLASGIYREARLALEAFLHKVLGDATILAKYANRKTVTVEDIIISLRRHGARVYGCR